MYLTTRKNRVIAFFVATLISAVNATFKFENHVAYNGVGFTSSALFDGRSRSMSDCARRCSNHPFCNTFTYVPDDITGDRSVGRAAGQCRGYSDEVTSLSGSSTAATGAKTFSKIAQGTALANVALHKTAQQTNTFSFNGFTAWAGLALDGDFSTVYTADTCSETLRLGNLWWQVDLGATFDVYALTITASSSYGWWWLQSLDVDVYMQDPSTSTSAPTSCVFYQGPAGSGATVTLSCRYAPIRGRHVKITARDDASTDALVLCEVQVMAHALS